MADFCNRQFDMLIAKKDVFVYFLFWKLTYFYMSNLSSFNIHKSNQLIDFKTKISEPLNKAVDFYLTQIIIFSPFPPIIIKKTKTKGMLYGM